MTANRDQAVKEIFASALELEDAVVRAGYLAEACGADLDLRREVDSLLEAYQQAGAFLQPHQDLSATDTLSESPGMVTGRYRLVRQIGEGGFGVVYEAEQLEPVRRQVALKIIKLGMDTKEVIARFEAERKALALMDHPHIAKVFDAGCTESQISNLKSEIPRGRPYFVMELVSGLPITEYCDQHSL
jgi:eukaryotic-like serine/threonine-protein kinase